MSRDTRGLNFTAMVAGLAELDPVTIRGRTYTGADLAAQVAVNPQDPDEGDRTPQLISEFGRLLAAAERDKNEAETDYRVWRETEVFRVTNNLEAAAAAGFACAAEDGGDEPDEDPGDEAPKRRAKPKAPKAPKLPSQTAAEGWVRTLPRYRELYRRKAEADEAFAVMAAALEAAKARTWALRATDRAGVDDTYRRRSDARAEEIDNLAEREEAVAAVARSPLPPWPNNHNNVATRPSPPPPPTREEVQS